MFFSKYARNRHSKQKINWSGQIFPVLLICLAGLIAAYFVTKIVGEANIAKTHASNAADAGSLSAASCWAGAFNRLIYRNWFTTYKDSEEKLLAGQGHTGKYMGYSSGSYYYYKEMRNYYVQMRKSYKTLKEAGEIFLLTAASFIQQAIDKATATISPTSTIDPTSATSAGLPQCSEIWARQLEAQALNLEAAEKVEKAARAVGAFHACDAYMGEGNYYDMWDGITSWFKTYQNQQLCDAFDFMGEAYKGAIRTGQYYALSNSNYTSNLTNAQADAFNFWLGGGETGDVFNPDAGGSLSYQPTCPTPPNCGCSITVTVVLPKIDHYTIKMATWNYPKQHQLAIIPILCKDIDSSTGEYVDYAWPIVPDLSDDPFNVKGAEYLTNVLFEISNYFKRLAALNGIVYGLTSDAATCCNCDCGGSYSDTGCSGDCDCDNSTPPVCQDTMDYRCNFVEKYNLADKIRNKLVASEQCILALLTDLKIKVDPAVDGLSGSLSVQTLRDWNGYIWDNLWPDPNGDCKKSEAVHICTGVNHYWDVVNTKHPSMMAINIDKVTLTDESWETSCKVVSSCGGTSFSKSKFCKDWPCSGKGELVGDAGPFLDDYYPEITATTP